MQIETDESGTIRLAGEATIYTAEELHAALVTLQKETREEWVLDLGGLTDLDTAGVQVLFAFKRSAPSVRVHSCPQALRERLAQTGLLGLLV